MNHSLKAAINRFLNEKNVLRRHNILHGADGTGLTDIFASDFKTALLILSGCPMVGEHYISELCYILPGGNKKLDDDEKDLIYGLLANGELGFDPEYTASHPDEAYRYCIKIMKKALKTAGGSSSVA